jgi:hypothetical protein
MRADDERLCFMKSTKQAYIIIFAMLGLAMLYDFINKPLVSLRLQLGCDMSKECRLSRKLGSIINLYQGIANGEGCIPGSSAFLYTPKRGIYLTEQHGSKPIKTQKADLLHFHVFYEKDKPFSLIIDSRNFKLYSGSDFSKTGTKIDHLITAEPDYVRKVIAKFESNFMNMYSSTDENIPLCPEQ